MDDLNTIEDIYYEINQLINELEQQNEQSISRVLYHRMYKVSWTSNEELFEEIQNILKNFLQTNKISKQIHYKIKNLIEMMKR